MNFFVLGICEIDEVLFSIIQSLTVTVVHYKAFLCVHDLPVHSDPIDFPIC